MGTRGRVGRVKVERPEVHRVVRCGVEHAERESEEAALYRLTAPEEIHLDRAVAKLISIQPNDAHARPLAKSECARAFGVDQRRGAAGGMPSWARADIGEVEGLGRLAVGLRCRGRERGDDEQGTCHIGHDRDLVPAIPLAPSRTG